MWHTRFCEKVCGGGIFTALLQRLMNNSVLQRTFFYRGTMRNGWLGPSCAELFPRVFRCTRTAVAPGLSAVTGDTAIWVTSNIDAFFFQLSLYFKIICLRSLCFFPPETIHINILDIVSIFCEHLLYNWLKKKTQLDAHRVYSYTDSAKTHTSVQ